MINLHPHNCRCEQPIPNRDGMTLRVVYLIINKRRENHVRLYTLLFPSLIVCATSWWQFLTFPNYVLFSNWFLLVMVKHYASPNISLVVIDYENQCTNFYNAKYSKASRARLQLKYRVKYLSRNSVKVKSYYTLSPNIRISTFIGNVAN